MHIVHEFMTGREYEAIVKAEGRFLRLLAMVTAGFVLGVAAVLGLVI